jgi:outer membrane protein
MNSYKLGGALLACLVFAVGVFAQQPAPTKIGFVDVERAIYTIAEGKARLKDLEAWARPRQEELGKLAKEINDLQAEIAAKRGTVSDEALEGLNRQLVSKQRQGEDKQRIAKRDFEEKQNSVLQELGSKLQALVAEYGDKNSYAVIFILKASEVAYLAPSNDLTDIFIKLYNDKYPLAANAPAAPAK